MHIVIIMWCYIYSDQWILKFKAAVGIIFSVFSHVMMHLNPDILSQWRNSNY
jgi:hypothetical protein